MCSAAVAVKAQALALAVEGGLTAAGMSRDVDKWKVQAICDGGA